MTTYNCTALTSGASESLDYLDGDDLYNGDLANTVIGSFIYHHILSDDNSASTASPYIIAPALNPGTKRWLLTDIVDNDFSKEPMLWRGAWSTDTLYQTNDMVSYDGASYICVVPVTSVPADNPTVDTTSWDLMADQGEDGEDGEDGSSGLNTAVVFLYRRAATTPTKPSTTATYTFSTGVLTGHNNSWTQDIPAHDGNPVWVIQAVAQATAPTDTDTIASGEWGTQIKLNEDGSDGSDGSDGIDGLNQATINLYQRKSSAPGVTDIANPITYTFSNKNISGSIGAWATSVPAGTDPLYITSAVAIANTATDTIARAEWSTPVIMTQDGVTYYTWIKYSEYSDGTDLHDTPTVHDKYIGLSYNNTSETESTDKADYTWSLVNTGTTNLLTYYPFVPGTGSQDGFYYAGIETQNVREEDETPFGGLGVIWKVLNTVGSTSIVGGFSSIDFTIDPTKRYRFSTFYKQGSTTGLKYFGFFGYDSSLTRESMTRINAASSTTYPYFLNATDMPTDDEWYLIVGHIHPYDTSLTANIDQTAIYHVATGEKTSITLSDYKWNATTVTTRTRFYHYNDTSESGAESWFFSPRIDLCDGSEPSINDLLRRGDTGPGVVYRGEFVTSPGETYYYTSQRRDIVYYSSAYYIFNKSTSSSGTTSYSAPGSADWTSFGATFSSVATKILLAEESTVTNTLVIGSTSTNGIIRSYNKPSYAHANAGFYLSANNTSVNFDVGNSTNYLRFDSATGSVSIAGSLSVLNASDVRNDLNVVEYDDYRVSNSQTENSITTIANPQGGTANYNTFITGAIVVTLPQSWTSTMMKFEIDVYLYSTSKSFKALVGGYNRVTSLEWLNTFAQIVGNTASDNRIRFGHDGAKCCIVIGETTSSWPYPQIAVKNFQAGYGNFAVSQWDDGWAVSFVTDLSGYTFTSDFSDALLDAKSILGQGALATEDTVGVTDCDTTIISDGYIVTGLITASNIDAGTLSANRIEAGSLNANKITSGTITATQIAGSTITGSKIAATTITASNIAAGTITATQLASNSVTADQINVSSLSAVDTNTGTLTINNPGYICSSGKTSASSTTAGFFLGYDSGYKFTIGDATNYLKWDGSDLDLKTSSPIIIKNSNLVFHDTDGTTSLVIHSSGTVGSFIQSYENNLKLYGSSGTGGSGSITFYDNIVAASSSLTIGSATTSFGNLYVTDITCDDITADDITCNLIQGNGSSSEIKIQADASHYIKITTAGITVDGNMTFYDDIQFGTNCAYDIGSNPFASGNAADNIYCDAIFAKNIYYEDDASPGAWVKVL